MTNQVLADYLKIGLFIHIYAYRQIVTDDIRQR